MKLCINIFRAHLLGDKHVLKEEGMLHMLSMAQYLKQQKERMEAHPLWTIWRKTCSATASPGKTITSGVRMHKCFSSPLA